MFNAFRNLICCLAVATAWLPAAALADGAPEIAAVSTVAEGPTLVFGAGFDDPALSALVRLPGEDKRTAEQLSQELPASLQRVLAGQATTPEIPPDKDRAWRKVEHHDAHVLLCDTGGHASSYPTPVKVLYVRSSKGTSRPYVMNRPEIWGISPRRVARGGQASIWGCNLGSKLALVSPAGKIAILDAYVPYNTHSHRPEAKFVRGLILPEGIEPGAHRLFSWGGHGELGWSEGLALEVAAPPKPPARVFDVSQFGAVGDGIADDSQAIVKALEAAKEAGGGRVRVPPGRYVISRSLFMPENVGLFGLSRETCVLMAHPDRGVRNPERSNDARWMSRDHPLVAMAPGSTLQDLTLEVTSAPPPPGLQFIVHIPGGSNITLRRLALVDKKSGVYGEYPDFRVWDGIEITGSTQDLVLEESLISTSGHAIACWPSHNQGARIRYNTFTTTDPHIAFVLVSLKTMDSSWIEGNRFVNGGRAKTEQTHVVPYPVYRTCYLHNHFENNNKGDGEVLMHETGGLSWFGPAAAAGPTQLRAAKAAWRPTVSGARPGSKETGYEGYTAVITQGKGMGQFRRVVSNTADTLTIDRPWNVVPDATSTFGLMWGGVVECLFVGNDFFYCHYYSGIYGAGLRNVWVGEQHESVGGGTFLWPIHGPRVMALNLIYGNKYHERAGVVVTNERRPNDKTAPEDLAAYEKLVKCFGNEVRGCSIRERSYVSTENGQIFTGPIRGHWAERGKSCPITPLPGTEPAIAVWDCVQWGGSADQPELERLVPSTRWNLLAENLICRCPVGILVGKAVDRTVLAHNVMLECPTPIRDLGHATVHLRNDVYTPSQWPAPKPEKGAGQ